MGYSSFKSLNTGKIKEYFLSPLKEKPSVTSSFETIKMNFDK